MKRSYTVFAVMILLGCAASAQQPSAPAAQAPDMSALDQRMRDLEDRIIFLEGQVRQLKAQGQSTAPAGTAVPAATQPAATEQAAAPAPEPAKLGGAGVSAAKALNPDVSVIGDFISTGGHNRISSSPAFQMHESEVGLQAIVDPYAKADFFISFGEQGVNLEEGYLTFTALPKGFVARAGKMRAAFGKVNTLHNHVLPWVDRPLVTQNLVGGEDGINDAGISVQHIIPAPMKWFLELTGQAFRGDSSDVFQSSEKNDVSTVGHLRAYRDLTDNANLDMGASYSRGHGTLGGQFITQLYGVDATYRWKPLRRSIYHQFVARSEFIWRQQEQPSQTVCMVIGCAPANGFGFQRAFGYYASGDYQFARRWFVGGRYDNSDRAFNSHLNDNGGSLVLSYMPSEFAVLRGQYRLTRYAEHFDAHEVLLQLQFALGAHGAHPF